MPARRCPQLPRLSKGCANQAIGATCIKTAGTRGYTRDGRCQFTAEVDAQMPVRQMVSACCHSGKMGLFDLGYLKAMSILEGQIDFLAGQVKALPSQDPPSIAQDIAEAVALSLSMFERILSAQSSMTSLADLYRHWLVGADSILVLLRSLKSNVPRDDRRQFMRAYLKAKAAIASYESPSQKSRSLDEVMGELQP